MKLVKKRVQRFALLLLFLIGLEGCGPNIKEEAECGFVQNAYGQRVSWNDSAPVGLYLHESFPAAMIPGLEKAIAHWSQVLGRPAFRIIQNGYQSPGPRQDGVNVIYWMNTWEANKRTEQARTSVYWVGDQIREADIKINDHNFDMYLDTPRSPLDVHFESLMLHELGHVLGLKHKDDSQSVMSTYLASSVVRTQISKADQENLKCEY